MRARACNVHCNAASPCGLCKFFTDSFTVTKATLRTPSLGKSRQRGEEAEMRLNGGERVVRWRTALAVGGLSALALAAGSSRSALALQDSSTAGTASGAGGSYAELLIREG